MLERGYILKRIAIHRDDVGPFPGFKRSDLIRPAKQVGVVDRRRLSGLEGVMPRLSYTANSWAFRPCG